MVHFVYTLILLSCFAIFFSENWDEVYLEYKIKLCTYLEKIVKVCKTNPGYGKKWYFVSIGNI